MPRAKTKPQRKTRSELAQNTKIDTETENMNRETALEYVNQIKKEFADTPEVYAEFTQTLKDFDAWSITTDEFIMKVCALFCDKPHLVTGLNRFLPSGFKIQQCEDGMYRCKVIPSVKKQNERKLTLSKEGAGKDNKGGEPDDMTDLKEDDVEDFVYDIKQAQELYKSYCKERRYKDVAVIQAKGLEIRKLVVPLLQWLKDDYYVLQKGVLFTKMIRAIKKIMMYEERWMLFSKYTAPDLKPEDVEAVKKGFLNLHCLSYHRLVEGYMQCNDVLGEDDSDKLPEQGSSRS